MMKFILQLLMVVFLLGILVSCNAQNSEIKRLNDKAVKLYNLKKYDDAIQAGEKSLKLAEKLYGADNAAIIPTLKVLNIIYTQYFTTDKKIKTLKRIVKIDEKAFGLYDDKTIKDLNNLAYFLKSNYNYNPETFEYYQQLLSIYEKKYGENDIKVTDILDKITDISTNINYIISHQNPPIDFPQTMIYCKRSIEIKEKIFGIDSIKLCRPLSIYAELDSWVNPLVEAEPYYERLLTICEKNYKNNNDMLADAYNFVGDFYYQEGKYNKAEELIQRAYRMNKDVYLELLAKIYTIQGKYSKASFLYLQLMSYQKKDTPRLAPVFNDIGLICYKQGHYNESLAWLNRSAKISENVENVELLIKVYLKQDKESLASPLYLKLEKLYKESMANAELYGIPLKDNNYMIPYLNGLGDLYNIQKRYDEAKPLFLKAIAIGVKRLDCTIHPDVAASVTGLAEVYFGQGKYDEAEPQYKQALDIRKKAFNENHPDIAESLENLAKLYEKTNRQKEADDLKKQAADIREMKR